MRRIAVCFVDDDPEELTRFKTVFKDRFEIGVGHSPREARLDLQHQGKGAPDLFLLDMYIPDGPLPTQEQLESLHKAREKLLKANADFRAVLAKMGQSSEGGFKLARELRRASKIGFAFFTRKAILEDAISAYEDLHAVSVIKKPDPNPAEIGSMALKEAYDRAMEKAAGLVAERIERAVARCSWWGRHRSTMVGFAIGILASIMAAAMWEVTSVLFRAIVR